MKNLFLILAVTVAASFAAMSSFGQPCSTVTEGTPADPARMLPAASRDRTPPPETGNKTTTAADPKAPPTEHEED